MPDDPFTRQVALNRQNGLEGGAWILAQRQQPEAYRAYLGQAAPVEGWRAAVLCRADGQKGRTAPDPRAREQARALVEKMRSARPPGGGAVPDTSAVRKTAELAVGAKASPQAPGRRASHRLWLSRSSNGHTAWWTAAPDRGCSTESHISQ